jgi:hypothetical protein
MRVTKYSAYLKHKFQYSCLIGIPQVTQNLNMMVRMSSELETNIVSVERTKEYSELPTEVRIYYVIIKY